MKETESLSSIIAKMFRKYNTTLFTVAIVGALMYCILTLAAISQRPLDSTINNGNAPIGVIFNTVVADKITNLRVNTSDPSNQTLPVGRINPFSE